MTYEIFGADMADPSSQEQLLQSVVAIRSIDTDFMCETINGFDTYANWATNDPETYKEFVTYCINHEDEMARGFIAHRLDYLLEAEPVFTIDAFTTLLKDGSDSVRFGAAENAKERMTDLSQQAEESIANGVGLASLSQFLQTLDKALKDKQQNQNAS